MTRVVDVSNSLSFGDAAATKFFEASACNLLAQEAAVGERHQIALLVVGTERLSESGYFQARIAQEKLMKVSSIQYSIVHTTPFFEFLKQPTFPSTARKCACQMHCPKRVTYD